MASPTDPTSVGPGAGPADPGRDSRHGGGSASRHAEAMAAAWERGERVTAAEVLGRHPDLGTETAIRLIYEEVCHRREAGLDVDTDEVVRRYPRWGDELRALFDCDRLLGPSAAFADFPDVGETLGPFRLLAELGRGASGRTFLATDPGLADRHVVVKVISDDQEEHLALAQLRHTHIVPLFSEHSFPDRGLRLLCMPYLGGTSLAKILADLAGVPPAKRSGKLLVELIDQNTRAAPAPFEAPFRRGLEQASYVEAVTWIAACLADALHYAHTRGLVHMDVKPSNVLITVDGQPLLLDFHLARGPIRPSDRVAGRLGGTPGWMSPEQTSAMGAVEEGRPVAGAVDGRTDIFALGLLLRDALAAPGPARDRPGVSVGLGDVLRKCVARSPSDRYPDAATLAEDLRRHLNDLPLRGVGNRSPVERWRKWRRRHPGALAWVVTGFSLFLAAAVALAVSVTAYRQRVGQLEAALEDGRRARAGSRYDEAIRTLKRGLESAETVPAVGDLTRAMGEEVRLARRGRMARELHGLADLIRFRYGIDLPSLEDARALAEHCRTVWEQRGRLVPGADALDTESEQQIKIDLLEIAAVWVDLRVKLTPPSGADGARRDALRVLGEAEALFGPSRAIDLRREQLAAVTGGVGSAGPKSRAPRSPWEHYDLGRYHLREGRIATAAEEFRRSLALRPQDFWPNFYQGLCAFRLGQPVDAAAAFRTCIALAPKSAVCHYNRALAHDALGRADLAHDDYTRAVELDPRLVSALLNRGIILYSRGRPLDAINDFERALNSRPSDRGTLGRLRYNLALAQLAQGDRSSARANAEEAVRLGCRHARPLADDLRAGRVVSHPPAGEISAPSLAEGQAQWLPDILGQPDDDRGRSFGSDPPGPGFP